MPYIDLQEFTADLPDGNIVNLIGGSLTIDETWAPYIQGSIVIPIPDDLDFFDPRDSDPPRVTLTMSQQFSDSDDVAVFTTTFAAGTIAALTTLYGALTVAAITAAHNRPWSPGVTTRPFSRSFDLGIRSRIVGVENTLTLTLASDEALMQDIAPLMGPGGDSGLPGVGGGVLNATTFEEAIPAILAAALPTATITEFTATGDISQFVEPWGIPGTPPNGIPWPAGQSAWAFASMLTDIVGARLWCDESRLWHVTALAPDKSTAVAVAAGVNMTGYSDTVSRDADWYDAVVITYTWTTPSGASSFTTDNTPDAPTPFSRVYDVQRDLGKRKSGFLPADGAAAALLAQVSNLGRTIPIEAINNFQADPGATLAVTLPDATALTGRIQSVTWDIGTREMSLTTRNMS